MSGDEHYLKQKSAKNQFCNRNWQDSNPVENEIPQFGYLESQMLINTLANSNVDYGTFHCFITPKEKTLKKSLFRSEFYYKA
jgi:hypothetical protein